MSVKGTKGSISQNHRALEQLQNPHPENPILSSLPIVNALGSQQLYVGGMAGTVLWTPFLTLPSKVAKEVQLLWEKHCKLSAPLQFISANIWTSAAEQIPQSALCGGCEDGGEERREGNQHIEYLLYGRNNVLLNLHKSSEDRTYHYHSHILYEEISAQKWNICPRPSS